MVFHTGLAGTPKVGDLCYIFMKIYLENFSNSDLTVTLNLVVCVEINLSKRKSFINLDQDKPF